MLKKAFTLTEMMIVLTIIGVITAIILPIGINSMPDENVMKFKKANDTLGKVIRELVTSDKYFCKGDLGLKADCSTEISAYTEQYGYFCNAIADLLSTKYVRCRNENFSISGLGAIGQLVLTNQDVNDTYGSVYPTKLTVTQNSITASKNTLDDSCKKIASVIEGPDIITTDNISFYLPGTVAQIGTRKWNTGLRLFSPPNQYPATIGDQNGYDIVYLTFCVDIDGIPDNVTTTDCVNECPFGYGIRADGKILTGTRAEEWIQKSMSDKD